MEHPLVQIDPNATLEELQTRINELTSKLSVAIKSGNGHLSSQVRMALETYQTKLQQRQQEEWEKSAKNNPDFGNKIDIS